MSIKILTFFIMSSASICLSKGTEVGNGGLGVMHAQKIYLFDFFESSIAPLTSTPFPETHRLSYENRLKNDLDPTQYPLVQISQKLAHISINFPVTAEILLSAIQLYRWQITLAPLKKISFDFLTPIDSSSLEIAQVASRVNSVIYINAAAWRAMSPEHQAGLVFHEILYALMLGAEASLTEEKVGLVNLKARQINAFIWGNDLTQEPSARRHLFEAGLFVQGQHSISSRTHEHSDEPNIEIEYQPILHIELPSPEKSIQVDRRENLNKYCEINWTKPIRVRYQYDTLIMSVQSDYSHSKILTSFGGPEFFGPFSYTFKNAEDCLTTLASFPDPENLTEHHGN